MTETKTSYEDRVYGPATDNDVQNPWTLDIDVNQDVDKQKFEAKKSDLLIPQLDDIKFILADALAGDKEALDDPRIRAFNFDKIKAALDWILQYSNISDQMRADLIENPWRLNYRSKPPTPEEFLTEKYIGVMAEDVYPHIRRAFIEFLDPMKPYRTACLSACIGSGKSLASILINLFISTHFALMWSPYKFFSLSIATVFVQALCATSQKKSSELLAEPFIQILEQSPFFIKVRTHAEMLAANKAFEGASDIEQMPWTTSSPTSTLSIANNVNYKLLSSPNGLLGQPQPLDSKVYTSKNTFKFMGDITVKDKVLTPNGNTSEIEEIFDQGIIDTYEIAFEDGRTVKCGLGHLWYVSYSFNNKNERIYEIVTTQFMIDHPELTFFIPEFSL